MSSVTFYVSIASGNTIDLATIFTSLMFFDKIRYKIQIVPNLILNIIDLKVSLKRIQTFLDSEEIIIQNFL
jgi:hypothetical protein